MKGPLLNFLTLLPLALLSYARLRSNLIMTSSIYARMLRVHPVMLMGDVGTALDNTTLPAASLGNLPRWRWTFHSWGWSRFVHLGPHQENLSPLMETVTAPQSEHDVLGMSETWRKMF